MTTVPVVGQTFTFGVQLRSQADANLYVTAPVLEAADFRISINGGGYDTLDNLPTVSPAGGDRVAIVVSAAETTAAGAGGNIHIDWKDNAGAIFYPDYAELIVHATDLDSLATAAAVSGLTSFATTSSTAVSGLTSFATTSSTAVSGLTSFTTTSSTAVSGLTSSAITSSTAVSGLTSYALTSSTAVSTVSSIATAIPASAWAYSSRTLTQAAASVTAAVSGSTLTIARGDTFTAALTDIGALTGYVSLDFTCKADKDDSDANAIIRIRKNASGLTDGLITINKATATTAGNGWIAIDDEATGDITITLKAAETDDLATDGARYYDIQMITATAVHTLTSGTVNVSADVTRLIA